VLGGLALGPSAWGDEPAAGARLFQRYCASCHIGAPHFAPPLAKYLVEGRKDAARAVITQGGTRMPAFKFMLSDAQVEAILGYIEHLDVPPKSVTNDRVDP
jgi:mono/diheme cytochrome c family protein